MLKAIGVCVPACMHVDQSCGFPNHEVSGKQSMMVHAVMPHT